MVAEVQQTLTNKNARIAAKKTSKKYKKMRNKRAPIPFDLNTLADTESIVYVDDMDLTSTRGAAIAAKKIGSSI